jgi:hypothetical protein
MAWCFWHDSSSCPLYMLGHCAVLLIPAQASLTSFQKSPKFFPCHTSEISPVTPLFATDPKAPPVTPLLATLVSPPPPSSYSGTNVPATAAPLRLFSGLSVNLNSATSVLKTYFQIVPGSGRLGRGRSRNLVYDFRNVHRCRIVPLSSHASPPAILTLRKRELAS